MPAEWDRHEATWLGWPHNSADWIGKFGPIPWVFAEIARRVTEGEQLYLVVNDKVHEASARKVLAKVGVDQKRVRFFIKPTDRGWMRDSGPIVTRDASKGRVVVRFRFNAWAKYPNWKKDATFASFASKRTKIPSVDVVHNGRHVVLEGGGLDVNGAGTVLTTEECLLDPDVQVRNPGFTARDYETLFDTYLGARKTLWLGHGVAGDDTHGHVDDLCRFVSRETVVLCSEKNPSDANYRVLAENAERLQGATIHGGAKLQVVPLPMPAPLMYDGQRLPASYANFYLTKAAVIVTTFNDPNDRIALGILAELIPDRPVIGIHAVDLVWGFGTLHCLTQQLPA
jgi:agmatine deiminase